MSDEPKDKPPLPERYIGDAVYVSFDGWNIWLRTGDGNDQRIALEPSVYLGLKRFVSDIARYFDTKVFDG